MNAKEQGQVSDATRAAEREEATVEHGADRPPTAAEEQEIEGESLDPGVAEHYRDMTERGVNESGEGRIP